MTRNALIPMTGASAIGPIPGLLTERAGDRAVERAFRTAELPLLAIEAPREPIPLRGLTTLWEAAARATGDRTFGFDGGRRMTAKTYGLWLQYCAGAPTFGEVLARIPRAIHFHQTGTHFTFEREGGVGVLRYFPAWIGRYPQHSNHIVGSLLRLAAAFLGEDWRPAWIELDYPRDAGWRQLEYAMEAPIRFGAGVTGVAVAEEDLRQRPTGTRAPALTFHDVAAEASVARTPEPLRSALNVAAFRLLDGETDIDGAAALCGIGVQSLQRRLRRKGLTYRGVLKRVRERRARALLRETDLSVGDVAYSLGYEDPPNFTRAFCRWTGQTPTEYRKSLVLNAGAPAQ
ncbi:AraC family transcriptional regulator [Tropicimonas sediminicola]|uniref:Transcriptional regulator, AraC family n=1 Tax=Tropicimonas sediminicola TaxID=1031541 RepID=A0A239FY35_9RHOB|nr:AraC family transcriptional regulator [Tropicimonas sediminicola]SNS61103.1 transcriptional regulator, AraC family [Tropicimonas sediminicola]